jgi:hypothetical protein
VKRASGGVLAFIVAGISVASSVSARADGTAVGAGVPCPFQSLQDYNLCYPPQEKAIAQRRFAGRPIDPSQIVKRLSGKPLTAVVTGQHFVGPTLRTSRKVTLLEYDFGPVPMWNAPTPTPTPTTTQVATVRPANWTRVIESPPPFLKLKGIRVSKFPWDGGRWELDEELLVHHDLAVSIFSNENRAIVVAIGRALMKKDKLGG